MASAQEPGLVRMYAQDTTGNKKKIFQARIEDTAPSGGAPEGASSSVVTPDQRLSVASPVRLLNDWTLLVTFEPDESDGIDASDCKWSVPVTTPSGSNQLGRDQFQNPALADQALVADREVTIAGYKVTEGALTLGPGKIYLDLQDDTA